MLAESGVDRPVFEPLAVRSLFLTRARSSVSRLSRDGVEELADIPNSGWVSFRQAAQFIRWLLRRLRSESWIASLLLVRFRDDGFQNSVAASSQPSPLSSAPSS